MLQLLQLEAGMQIHAVDWLKESESESELLWERETLDVFVGGIE